MPTARPHFANGLTGKIKSAIAGEVRALLVDEDREGQRVEPQADGLFGPDAVAWRVHRDVTGMMTGGMAALLMQMLHPAVLAGVWDHSRFREDMAGRLRRTARFIAVTTYGARDDAEAAIARVRNIHHHVTGTLPDGQAYSAEDPQLLAWVHLTEVMCFLAGWRRYGEPTMSGQDQDRYIAEMARIAEPLGVSPIPRSVAEAQRMINAMRPALHCDDRTREVASLILDAGSASPRRAPVHALTAQAAIDLLPRWARRMHGLSDPILTRPLVRAGTFGLAQTLRWALR